MHPTLRLLSSSRAPKPKIPASQFKRGQTSLLGGSRVLSGNSIPFSHHKSRRKWYPNVQPKSLYSASLGSMVRVTLTARVLRTVDKMGGFDNYILNSKAKLLGDEGMRWRLILNEHTQQQQQKQQELSQLAETSLEASSPSPPASHSTVPTNSSLFATKASTTSSSSDPQPPTAASSKTTRSSSVDTPKSTNFMWAGISDGKDESGKQKERLSEAYQLLLTESESEPEQPPPETMELFASPPPEPGPVNKKPPRIPLFSKVAQRKVMNEALHRARRDVRLMLMHPAAMVVRRDRQSRKNVEMIEKEIDSVGEMLARV